MMWGASLAGGMAMNRLARAVRFRPRPGGFLAALAVAIPAAGLAAQDVDARSPEEWNGPVRPPWEQSAEPRVESVPLPEAPPASTTLRVTPTTADRIERELQAVRDRLLELRAERSRMNDELRRLGDMHGSLDEALGDASPRANSGVRAGRRRQDVEERERTLGNAQSSLEVEERTLMRSRIVLERLLRELRRRPDALPRAVS
jgi:hypothetical protein